MKKLARAIVKMRRLILIAAVLLLIPAAVGAIATPINYDILSYLPQELDSRVGQLLLETDYHLASTNMITVEGMPTNELLAMKAEIDEVPDVLNTFWLSDVLDPAVPTEMLPADVQQFMFGKNDSTILIVQLGGSSVSEETMQAVAQIKKILRKDCFFGGISVILSDTKELVMGEMPWYVPAPWAAVCWCCSSRWKAGSRRFCSCWGCSSRWSITLARIFSSGRSALSPRRWRLFCSWA